MLIKGVKILETHFFRSEFKDFWGKIKFRKSCNFAVDFCFFLESIFSKVGERKLSRWKSGVLFSMKLLNCRICASPSYEFLKTLSKHTYTCKIHIQHRASTCLSKKGKVRE